jgi:tRNA pseudouridine38-40 synthase
MRLRLTLSYDGGHFSGWQSQPKGDTVQDALEKAFGILCGSRIIVHGAGRTDAGVHALGQCAHADVPEDRLPVNAWLPALNAHLPAGVRIMALRRAAPDFHARFSATGKVYRYTIWNGPVMPPLLLGRAWHVPWKINRDVLASACAALVGTHDFAAFSAKRSQAEDNTVRTVSSIRIQAVGPRIALTFHGPGFLYKMVRILTAAVVRCGCQKLTLDDVQTRLAQGGPRLHHVAPAHGLCLVRVGYRPTAG